MFEPLPANWKMQPIKELAQVVSGGTPSRNVAAFWENGSVPWVTPTDITASSGKYISDSSDHITPIGLQSSAATLLPAGAILMTSRATLGESRISTVPVCTNQGFKSLVGKPGVVAEFLYYQMLLNKGQYSRFGSGSTFLEVGKKDTERFLVAVGPFDHQLKISKILSIVDAQIEATEALIAKQERVRAGLFQDLFTRGVDEHGALRPPREEAPQLYQQTELGWLPKQWETAKVGSVLASVEQGWSPDCSTEPAQNDEWGVLKTSSVTWSGFVRGENKRLPSGLPPRPNLSIREDDVLMTRAGPNTRVGVVCLVEVNPGKLMLSDKIYKLRPLPTIEAPYLALALSCNASQRELDSMKRGLAESQTNISQSIVKRLKIPMPMAKEREAICGLINSAGNQNASLLAHTDKLSKQKSALMQELLTGRVSVAPLLERNSA